MRAQHQVDSARCRRLQGGRHHAGVGELLAPVLFSKGVRKVWIDEEEMTAPAQGKAGLAEPVQADPRGRALQGQLLGKG